LIDVWAQNNYVALGGANWLKNKGPNSDPTPVFVQEFVPMSQAWCRLSVQKSPTPILVDASLSDTTATSSGRERIKRNIANLYLRMLGEPASDGDVAELLSLFQAYEPNGSEAGWTAVCAALVRHPLWVTY
jgi:hypothetical protein